MNLYNILSSNFSSTLTLLILLRSFSSSPVLVVVSAQGNFCGTSWVDAVSTCQRSCPSGAPTDCGGGETCFANTPCTEQVSPPRPPPPTPPPVAIPVVSPQQQQQTTQQQFDQQFNSNNGPYGNVHSQTATCGLGSRGNGICPIPTECCSQYGHCGTTPAHCNSPEVIDEVVQTITGATCGNGNVGNGICPMSNECCSKYGHCGTTPEHCVGSSTVTTNNNNNVNTNTNGDGGMTASNVLGTCGGGSTGNGICSNNNECCSQYGFCGTTSDHCSGSKPQIVQPIGTPPTSVATPSVAQTPQFNDQGVLVPVGAGSNLPITPQLYGSCGNGSTGNGICELNSECCSQNGFCGNTLEHCMNKVGPDFPGQEAVSSATSGGASQQQQQQSQVQPGGQQQQQYPGLSTNGNIQFDGGQTQTTTNNNGGHISSGQVLPHGTNKKIIGYYAGWQWYDRDKLADPSNMDFRKVQRVNYAFFQPDTQGNIYGTDRWGDPQLLFGAYSSKLGGGVQKCSYDGPHEVNCAFHEHNTGLIYRAHQMGAEVYPSIGGWTLSDNFPTLSANPTSRDAFAKNCIEILTYYGFDGIDIDWEYPGYVEHSGTPGDRVNFTKMLASIKAALDTLTRSTGKSYGLTAALPCNPDNIANIEVEKLTTILTEFNLMSYDFHGSWDEVTGANAPLYYQGYGNKEFNIHRCVENYVALGVPREKINIGLPFYGRSFKFASEVNQPHGGNDLANWPEDEGTPQYFNVYNKLPLMTQLRDNKSKTQYAYTTPSQQTPSNGFNSVGSLPEGLVSFDDERAICDKVHYAQENDLGGFIVWELSGDMLDDLRTPLLDITNVKLSNPSLECCSLHSEEECEKERLEREQVTQSQMNGFDIARWDGKSDMSGSVRREESLGVLALLIATVLLL